MPTMVKPNDYDYRSDQIPTVDYTMLFCDDDIQCAKALNYLTHACQEYGFFYLVNHGIPDSIFERVFKGISDFFDPATLDERKQYGKKNPTDKIRWGLKSSHAENREYLKVTAHPHFHCPTKPDHFSEAMSEYFEGMTQVVHGLSKAVSKTLGQEDGFIEKALNLKLGFDVSAMNLYPPNCEAKGTVGVPDHTDPGFLVSLTQDVNGGLQILSDKGDWIDANMPPNAIFINLGDHLEILTNGKYKSHVHRVVVGNNKVKRISVATLHGPALAAFVKPVPEFIDEARPAAYRGATYKQSLEAHGGDEIDVHSSIDLLRM